MKKLVLIFCLAMLPLSLASDTQHRFKVYVYVDGDDEQAINIIESYLKRELRLLGDVDIVSKDDDWKYTISIFFIALKRKDGTKTGNFAIANNGAIRLSKFAYNTPEDYERFQSTYGGKLGVGYFSGEALHEYCIRVVGAFDKEHLEILRSIFKK